jgi:tight adherence protein B
MRVAARLGLAALAALVAAGVASSASAPFTIVEAGGVSYPDQSYILTLPTARSLSRSDVRVTENGAAVSGLQLIRQSSLQGRSAVVLVIDESLTMKGTPIANAFAAARAFAAQASTNEQIAVVTFNGSVNVLQPFTTSAASIDSALAAAPTLAYGTKNYDALETAGGLLAKANVPSSSIIILTDGQSVGSVAKPLTVLKALAGARVRVFSVGLQSVAFNPTALMQMADLTGGRYVVATGPSKLQPILVELGHRLSDEYLLTYRSLQNPATRVAVSVSVRGIPGTAQSAYTTPVLKLVSAKPYTPSSLDKLLQSNLAMLAVAFVFASLIGFAIAHVGANRADRLLDRVGGFVSVEREQRVEPVARRASPSRRPGFLTRAGAGTERSQWTERLGKALDLAGIELPPVQFVILTSLATILAILILFTISPVVGLLGFLTPLLVRGFVKRRVERKRRAFAEQLPDNLDVLASALRAGHSLVSALAVVADDAGEPSKSEFQRVLAEEQFGAQLEDAFKVAVERMSSPDLDQVALVSRLQREMGSNSAEVLDRVIETVRGRMELRRLVRTLTAQGRLSRWLLTLLPVFLALIMSLVSSSYMSPLFHQTTGQLMLGVAVGMISLGSYLIGRIIDIRI